MNEVLTDLAREAQHQYERFLGGEHLRPNQLAMAIAFAAVYPEIISGYLLEIADGQGS